MKTIKVLSPPPVPVKIGMTGNNLFEPIAVDVSGWLLDGAIASVWLKKPGAAAAIPVASGTESPLIWKPRRSELSDDGIGELQVMQNLGTTTGQTVVIPVYADLSIIPSGEDEDQRPGWASEMMQAVHADADRAEAAAERAEEAGGDVSPEEIAQAVADYLDEHPVQVEEIDPKSVHFDGAQSLTAAQQEQARENIGAGTYSKPSGGIPASDLASGVIPVVPQMATAADMSDWTSGKTVDASALKADFQFALQQLDGKADISDIPTKTRDLTNDSGFQTAQDVQSAIAAAAELPSVSASDNGKFLRVVSGAWAAASVPFQTPRVAMTSADSTPTLDPNKLYVFPEMASITPTLNTPTNNSIANEYHFVFDSGATATVLTLPASVLQPDGFTVEANMHYEISILEGAMTAQGWAVSA